SNISKVHKNPKGLWDGMICKRRASWQHARYLGPYLSDNLGCTREVQLRLQALKAAWHNMKGFWTSNTSL
ncbi:MAG: hypothetical protein ACKPKO_03125, partial [Candidatus Fonsibacter sp.]